MNYVMNHVNFNVSDLTKSLAFYQEALGLYEDSRIVAEDHSFIIVYLKDPQSDFRLELTWLSDHPQKYDLGESEFHLALTTDDYLASLAKHQKMNCVCMINEAMGIYFINDPDDYWIEIIPAK